MAVRRIMGSHTTFAHICGADARVAVFPWSAVSIANLLFDNSVFYYQLQLVDGKVDSISIRFVV